jgi:hypothetical protein
LPYCSTSRLVPFLPRLQVTMCFHVFQHDPLHKRKQD